MSTTEFNNTVYDIVEEIPFGKVLTYGNIARLAGKPQCSRMVGKAMFNAPEDRNLPCHRVVNSEGRLAPEWKEHRELLEKEGVSFKMNGCVNMKKHIWEEAF